jgi:aspartyl-tRNA synthetase
MKLYFITYKDQKGIVKVFARASRSEVTKEKTRIKSEWQEWNKQLVANVSAGVKGTPPSPYEELPDCVVEVEISSISKAGVLEAFQAGVRARWM